MRRAFTLVELLVVIAVVALLVSLTLPGLAGARASARSAVCRSQLRQLGAGVQAYANDHKGVYPGDWQVEPREPYGLEPDEAALIAVCPADPHKGPISYGRVSPIGEIRAYGPQDDCRNPAEIPIAYDQGPWHPYYNVGFLYGAARRWREDDAP